MSKRKGHGCMFCSHVAKSAAAHALHFADEHKDRVGTGPSRRPWSCWSCAHESPPTTTTCERCGWAQHVLEPVAR